MNPWGVRVPPPTEAAFFNAARRTTFLLVEGGSDQCFWQAFVDHRQCRVRSMGSREKVLQELDVVQSKELSGFVAVVDVDFDRVDGTFAEKLNVVWTDFHDLEMILIASPALEKVLKTVGSIEKIDSMESSEKRQVRDILLEHGISLAQLRYVSRREDIGLTFRKLSGNEFKYLDYAAFCDRDTWKVDKAALIQKVLHFSNRHNLVVSQLLADMKALPEFDPWQFCVGHDLVGLLMVGLRKKLGTKNYQLEDLQKDLRLAFHRQDLERTEMYKQLREWEQQNAPYRIFA